MAIKFGDLFGGDININNPKLEEVFNKTKDMAESFGKKSAEHLELSRKRVEYLDAKTKLSKLFEKYGELQYNAFIGDAVDQSELGDIANRIAALKEKIEFLSIEIEESKAQFSDAVANATKKTRDAFQKEFDKMNKNEVNVTPEEVDVTETENNE